ncbi:helix-turn-helix transcriptional regulator [Mucilaginibacter sp. E4BP6]|uniref:helix-turn-helix transcriptional regulator n=1 Tax=Mucilaginibacter sp. E4BP6 TaxID=2723089 RepID=UPI0015C99C0C|nr:excisionase family DNA binding protein [Mucilaginibacter sp. E4BP6]
MAETDRFLTLAELCTYLGISRSLAYKLSHRNTIPKYRPTNGRVWFKKSDIDQWLNNHRIMSETELQPLIN